MTDVSPPAAPDARAPQPPDPPSKPHHPAPTPTDPAARAGQLPDPLGSVLADLERAQGADLADQVAIYQRIHTALTETLATTVEQSGAGGR